MISFVVKTETLYSPNIKLVSLDRLYWSKEHQAWIPFVQYHDLDGTTVGKPIDAWVTQFQAIGIPTAKVRYRNSKVSYG